MSVNGTTPVIGATGVGRSVARGILVATMLTAGGLLAGCASYGRDHVIVGSVPDDYRTRHPIVVAQSETVEDIVVPASARKLSLRDRGVAEEFAHRFRRSGARTLVVMIPAGSRNEAAARRIAHEITIVLRDRGISERQIGIQHYPAASHGDAATVRLVFSDITARVDSQCGQWDEDIVETGENRNYGNFGCATQQNLAAMVASPADLLGPRGETEIDSARRNKVIEDWRNDGTGDLPTLFDQ